MNAMRQAGAARVLIGIFAGILMALTARGIALGDGLIVITDGPAVANHFAFAPLEVIYHRVSVNISEQVAVTSVDEVFHNPNGRVLEGTYIFPLPDGAHVDHFSMDINGVQTEAEMLDADKARQYYEEIVRKYRDPALLEYAGRGAVKVRIFPIEANGDKHIKLQYTQALTSDSGLIEYMYPLNTEKFSSTLLQNVSVVVKIKSSDPIKSIYCPTQATEIKRDGDCAATVGYEENNARPDKDFKLFYSTSKSEVGANLMSYRSEGEDGYFMLLASPGLNVGEKAQAKDICFVLDTSGSMSEDNKLEQAKKALTFCLANLNPDDRFQVVRFSTDVEPLFEGFVAADEGHLKKAREFVEGLKPTGGTALNDALLKGLGMEDASGKDRPFDVVFLTDGMPTVGETNDDRIVENAKLQAGPARVFCFGIGYDVNTHLLDGIAQETRGTSSYVTGKEDIEVKVSNFFSKIREPVLTNVAVAFEGDGIRTMEIYPNVQPDLFKGESLTIFGKYSGSGSGVVKITGMINGEKREFVTDVKFAEKDTEHGFVPQLWATRRVGWLLDEIRLHGESKELKDEIVGLARKYGIVTPYTAYLIIEDEQLRRVPMSRRSLSEMEKDQLAMDKSSVIYKSAPEEAHDEQAQFGPRAVANAQAVTELKWADHLDQAAAATTQPMDITRAGAGAGMAGNNGYKLATNYAQQARVVNGRAFYQNNGVWTDSTIQANGNLKTEQIKLGSDEYFDLLKAHPEAAAWLALGDQVDVVIGDELVSVR